MDDRCDGCGGKIISEDEMAELDRQSLEAAKDAEGDDRYLIRHPFYTDVCVCGHPDQPEVDGLY